MKTSFRMGVMFLGIMMMGAVLTLGQVSTAYAGEKRIKAIQASTELAAFREAIAAKYAVKEKAFAENDADTIAEKFYSADVISVDYDGKTTIGREALRAAYREIVPMAKAVRVESIAVHVSGDAGWDWTNFHITPANPDEEPFSFVILFLWAKENGEWTCKGDMYVMGKMDELQAM